MKKIFVVVIVSFTFNLFAITDGIRYCQHIDLGGYCTDITSTRFDLSQYTWTGGTPQNDNVSSILVMSGWEAWVCKDANHYGDCMFLSAGTYNMTNYAGWNDQISSITVQPTTFYEAWSYYGKREFGESGTAPYGFAYAYACLNFVGCKRLFLKYPDSISSLSNYIVKKNQIRSIELDGNVKATLHRDGYSSKILFSSHKNFSISNSITQQYGYLNLTAFDQTVDGIMISMAPSIGFFQSELRQDFSGYPYILDFYNAYNFDNTTIDDARHEAYEVNFSLGVADPNYGSQTSMAQKVSYYQNDQYTQRYGDNYDLLAIAAHGTLDIMDTDPTVRNHWVAINSDLYPEDSNPYWYYKKYGGILKGWYEELPNYVEGAYSDWSKYIGTKSTEWVLDSSCGSFGNHIDQHHGNISWSEILDIYDGPSTENGILDNLHGYGGTRGDWFFFVDDGESLGEEFYLNLSQYSVSSAWVASFAHLWTYVSGVLMNRDARYLTKETCDCSSIFCVAAYMNNDHFHLYGTTQPDKGSRDNYPYTCMRRNSSWYLYDGTPYDPYLKMSSSVPSEVDGGVDETIY
ncbi:MAG TPA: hypothetical protein PKH10_01820, partial [bacterium]|nr:hypothetical protein [bacterium]